MPPPHDPGSSSELKLLHELIDSFDGSRPSQGDVEIGLESGLGRLMFLEGQMREHSRNTTGMRPSEEPSGDHGLVEEIRALREAVTRLRACSSEGDAAPLAHGFVSRADP